MDFGGRPASLMEIFTAWDWLVLTSEIWTAVSGATALVALTSRMFSRAYAESSDSACERAEPRSPPGR